MCVFIYTFRLERKGIPQFSFIISFIMVCEVVYATSKSLFGCSFLDMSKKSNKNQEIREPTHTQEAHEKHKTEHENVLKKEFFCLWNSKIISPFPVFEMTFLFILSFIQKNIFSSNSMKNPCIHIYVIYDYCLFLMFFINRIHNDNLSGIMTVH